MTIMSILKSLVKPKPKTQLPMNIIIDSTCKRNTPYRNNDPNPFPRIHSWLNDVQNKHHG